MSVTVITTVVTPAATYDLTDLQTVKSDLGVSGPDTDDQFRRWIAAASTAASNFCNRVFAVETVQDEFFPQRDSYPQVVIGGVAPLQLTRWPVIEPPAVSVTENGIALVEGTDFLVNAPVGQLVRLDGNGWPRLWPALSIVAVYEAGYATTPSDVVEAAILLVKKRYFGRSRDPQVRSENIVGVYEAQYWFAAGPGSTGNLPPDVQELLEAYRVPQVG